MSRINAELLYNKYAWGSRTTASKDITRFQSSPGAVTSYMIGQITFVNARKLKHKSPSARFSIPDFHYHILRQGEIPREYLIKNIRDLTGWLVFIHDIRSILWNSLFNNVTKHFKVNLWWHYHFYEIFLTLSVPGNNLYDFLLTKWLFHRLWMM